MCAWEVVLNSQERALEIYLSSISLATNLKPISFTKLSDELASRLFRGGAVVEIGLKRLRK